MCKGDLLYMDEGVHFCAAVGSTLARGATRAFPHQVRVGLRDRLGLGIGIGLGCTFTLTLTLTLTLTRAFPHQDYAALEEQLRQQAAADLVLPPHKRHRLFLLVEGVYACDGSLADLPTLLRLRDTYGCYLIVDETLSFGARTPQP